MNDTTCRWCHRGEYRNIVNPEDPNERWAGNRPDSVRQYGLVETGHEWQWKHFENAGTWSYSYSGSGDAP